MVGELFKLRKISRLKRANDGVAAVEFAMIAPVLLLMIFGILELSMMAYATSVIEGATSTSSRLAKTGFTDGAQSREDMIFKMIKDHSSLLVDVSKIEITAKSYGSFTNIGKPEPFTDVNGNSVWDIGEPFSDVNGNGQWDFDMGVAGLGGANDIVLYRVTYPWQVITPIMNKLLGDASGVYTITSSVIVKNEPYNIIQIGG